MSGPVTEGDAEPIECPDGAAAEALEISDARTAAVGGTEVRRSLPQRGRRMVGPWCFADHFGPTAGGLGDVAPHPHCGLQTVTWLLDGELVHRDSLGSEQMIRPGQLNLMSSGRGIAHSEETDSHRVDAGHGVQLWVALPDATRHLGGAFEHHALLPTVELDGATATVLVGRYGGVLSPARTDSPQVGMQLELRGRATLGATAAFEHAVIALDGPVQIDGRTLEVGQVAYLAPGREELTVDAATGRALVLGGEPWPTHVTMWWNFVAADRDEIVAAYRAWNDPDATHERFGTVPSELERIEAPRPPWLSNG